MITRSMIARETPDGIEAITCHLDGYPDHHLPILMGRYATEPAVARLLAIGDLSVLGPKLGRKHAFDRHTRNPKAKNWCLAYGRDGEAKNAFKRTYGSEAEFLGDAAQRWTDYLYLFRAERWLYRNVRRDEGWREANA